LEEEPSLPKLEAKLSESV
jgi:ubiquitin-activating enzyme E1